MADFPENEFNLGIILQLFFHFLDAAAPGLDEFQILEYRGQNSVSDLAPARAQFLDGQGIRKGARTGDLQHIVIDSYLDIASENGIVPVDDGIDQGLPNGLHGIFPPVFAVDFTDGCAQGDVFLDKGDTRLNGRVNRSIDGCLVEKHLFVGPLEPGACDLGKREVLLSALGVGKEQGGMGGVDLVPVAGRESQILDLIFLERFSGQCVIGLFEGGQIRVLYPRPL